MGIRIFERSSRGVKVTPTGQLLVQRGRELLADADRLAVELTDFSLGLQGHVRVLANASSIFEVLSDMLAAFVQSHPLIRVDLEERSSPETLLALLDGRADLGVVDIAHPLHGLRFHDLFTDHLALIVPRTHGLATLKQLSLRDAMNEDFICLMDGNAISSRLIDSPQRYWARPSKYACGCAASTLFAGWSPAAWAWACYPREAVGPQLACLPIVAVPITDAWTLRTHRLAKTREGAAIGSNPVANASAAAGCPELRCLPEWYRSLGLRRARRPLSVGILADTKHSS
ncbi:MAG: hypothetical protein IPJ18_03660 [Betaproteobacteria bacterium]|nr:hypothetical protein [Betaproteobacteria bacterium]